MADAIAELGYLALGSRLKRVAERLQADATRVHAMMGYPTQSGHFTFLATLFRRGPMLVGDLSTALGVSQPSVTRTHRALEDMGLTETMEHEGDRRQTLVRLTREGEDLMARMSREMWPHVRAIAEAMCAGPDTDMLGQLTRLETALDEASLESRVRRAAPKQSDRLTLVEWRDDLAGAFDDITRAWVSDMFVLEDNDIKIIENPREMIIDRGGSILFVEDGERGIVGTCALIPIEQGKFELTKMGVTEAARGLNAGNFLMEKILERAEMLDMDELFLLTNSKCEAAIHLYEKYGFVHDPDIMERYGARYERCNVTMSFPIMRSADR